MRGHDITGQRFGRLVALAPHRRLGTRRHRLWLCRCDCGRSHLAHSDALRNGATRSCGCYRAEVARPPRRGTR